MDRALFAEAWVETSPPLLKDSDTLKFTQADTSISKARQSLLNFCSLLFQFHTFLEKEAAQFYYTSWS